MTYGLVLTREPDERIVIAHGGNVIGYVTLVKTKGSNAQLGLQFPSEYTIHREEVWDAIQKQRAGEPVPTGGGT